MPFLALIARLYNGIESTSCQAERNFSALAFLIGHLRSTTAPGKVERLMFLRLNRLFIPTSRLSTTPSKRRKQRQIGARRELRKKRQQQRARPLSCSYASDVCCIRSYNMGVLKVTVVLQKLLCGYVST